MPRLASLFLPDLAIDRIRRQARTAARPDGAAAPGGLPLFASDPDIDPLEAAAACSCPRTPGFRPGARWAREAPAAPTPAPGPLPPALVTVTRSGQRIVLAALCPTARALGLEPGMALTQARLLVPELEIRDADPEGDQAWLTRLGLFAARRWTPRAALSGVDGLWLDLDGVTHLFGGEKRMCERILFFCRRLGFTARIAVAGTAGAAHALARFGNDEVGQLLPGQEPQALAGFPIAALRLDDIALSTARRLGVETIGDLLGLPRGPLERRFGSALLRRLDQAMGRSAEPFDPLVPAEPPTVLLRFMEPIATAEAIAEAMAEGTKRLVAQLGRDGLAVRRLVLIAERVDGLSQQIEVGTARGTRDPVHLNRLLAATIERIDPGFGIERMTLVAARVEPLGAQAIGSLLDPVQGRPDLVPLVDRLAGRLGTRRLYRVSAVESDVPERSLERVGPFQPTRNWPSWPRPARLLSPPELLDNVMALLPDQPPRRFTWRGRLHRVRQADGPERITGEWWKSAGEADAVRDYFQVEDEQGQRYWLFRRGDGENGRTGDMRWYLHGLFG